MLNELDEREVKLINELSDETGYSIEEIKYALDSVKQACISIIEEIKRIVKDVYDYFKIKKSNDYSQNWHVPVKVRIPNAPFIKDYNLQFARNNL